MLTEFILWLMRHSPTARRWLWRTLHQFLGRKFADVHWWTFMNYGYAADGGAAAPLALKAEDEQGRVCAQLYHHIASAIDIAGREVLEVGCGRGGGASYISRYLAPKHVTGLDIAASQIAFCRRVHGNSVIEFIAGSAESLPFENDSFDVVINVESSFCYGDMAAFLAEVDRVLRPGGYFLLADSRLVQEVEPLFANLHQSPLAMIAIEDISKNVLRALEQDSDRHAAAAEGIVPRPLRGCMDVFMGIEGTRIPTLLGSGELVYFNIVMRHGKSAPRRDNVAAIAPPAGGQVHRKLPPPALY